jgi:ADP-ribose pyrophosphatase
MLIHKSRVFDLYSENVNSRRAPFEYVGHRGSVAALLTDPDDEIGLLAHHRPAVGRTLFELPAGTLEPERGLEETMIAELREEAGFRASPEQLHRLTSLYASPGYTTELLTLFLVRVTREQRKRAENLRWFRLSDLNRLIHEQELIDMKTVAAITAYQAVLWKGPGDEIL